MKKKSIAVTLLWLRNRLTFQRVKYCRHCGVLCAYYYCHAHSHVRTAWYHVRRDWPPWDLDRTRALVAKSILSECLTGSEWIDITSCVYILHTALPFLLPSWNAARKEYKIIYSVRLWMYIQYEFIRDIYSLNMKITYGKYGFVANTYNKFN